MAASGTLNGSDAVAGPTSRISKIRGGLTPREWTKVGLMAATVLGLNIAGWGMLVLALRGHHHVNKTAFFGFGTGVLAYTLGMRHAFDADHIAAIDNTTRKLIHDGERPLSVGYFFSLGHSTIVFVLAVLLNFGIRALNGAVQNNTSALHHWTGIIGTSVSGTFLYLIGLLNLVVLFSIIRVSREMRKGRYDDAELERQLDARGLMNRVLGGYAKRVDSPAKMYPVGVLFGLGFDTATEVALLVIAGSAGAAGLPWYAILCLPILFAAGMSLLDSIDGSFMNFAYGWAFSKPVRKVFYNITITGLSVAVALVIGTIELGGLIAQHLGLSGNFWDWFENIDINLLGYIIVGMFLATWAIALSVWHLGHLEERWSPHLASSPSAAGQSDAHARPPRVEVRNGY
jgi:high-affinity nickel-transport protein